MLFPLVEFDNSIESPQISLIPSPYVLEDSRFLLQLNEFEITLLEPKMLHRRALSDLFALLPSGEYEPIHDKFSSEEACAI